MPGPSVPPSVDLPRVIVNAKAYPEATGRENALRLARACDEAAQDAGTVVGLAPPMTELSTVGRFGFRNVAVLSQNVDPHPPGAATGWVTVEALEAVRAKGSLLNHAEHKLPAATVADAARRLRERGLWSLLCADGMAEVRSLAALGPTWVAVEPPELIGGNVSVTSADPRIVQDAATAVRKASPPTRPLCGAGVKTGRDVAKAIELGADGVLLASGVVKAADPKAALADLLSGLP